MYFEKKKLWYLLPIIVGIIMLISWMNLNHADDEIIEVKNADTSKEIVKSTPIKNIEVKISKENKSEILVDIKGAVRNPGVKRLVGDVRLFDVIEAAGGLQNAEEHNLPLAKKVNDQDTINIPRKGDMTTDIIKSEKINTENSGTDNVVHLNQATATELGKLTGVGPKKADAIIKYRNEHGGFKTIDELKNIKGIGPKTIEKWQGQIVID